jgi:hypothetical protein
MAFHPAPQGSDGSSISDHVSKLRGDSRENSGVPSPQALDERLIARDQLSMELAGIGARSVPGAFRQTGSPPATDDERLFMLHDTRTFHDSRFSLLRPLRGVRMNAI